MRKVIVVHKTHLDIGFTDSARSVLDRYLNVYLPGAMATAQQLNTPGRRRFVWTVGSLLIDEYLRRASDPKPLCEAIERGDIAWHAMPCTTHTELMDRSLAQYALSVSKRLDERFGRRTIAAKMTDVPGHTHALLPCLSQAGVRYLHIGVNGSSRLPKAPVFCRWRCGDAEVLLHYASEYGSEDALGDVALCLAHTEDNLGPPTPDFALKTLRELERKYPNAQIVAGTLDDFAREALAHVDELPIIDEEIGDTWIHGAATDPYKMGAYRELLRARDRWLADEPSAAATPQFDELQRNLLMTCEHTWGRDSKRWLGDYRNWAKRDFEAARKRDLVPMEDALPAGERVFADAQALRTGRESYGMMEASWAEQRAYARNAAALIPPRYREALDARLAALRPSAPDPLQECGERSFVMGARRVEIAPSGALLLPNEAVSIQPVRYAVYGADTVRRCYESYNRNRQTTYQWSWPDFGKPGLEASGIKDHAFDYELVCVHRQDHTLTVALRAPGEAAEAYGAPRTIHMAYRFGDAIDMRVSWYQKDASRIPEELILPMRLGASGALRVWKLGIAVDPLRVLEGGNRRMHAVDAVSRGSVRVETLHAPLCAIGEGGVYDISERIASEDEGIAFVLYNNRWNTNFSLYYEENAAFDFHIVLP